MISTDPVVIAIDVSPVSGTHAYAVEEELPSDAVGVSISDGGSFDRFTHKVKWGPFLDDQPRTLSYELVVPAAGNVTLNGSVNTDGTSIATVQGNASVTAPDGGFQSWLLSEFGATSFTRPESDPASDTDVDHLSTAVEYYFALNPRQVDANPVTAHLDGPTREVDLSFVRRTDATGFALRLEESGDLITWNTFEGDPDQPIIVGLGNGLEQVSYQLPAVQGARILRLFLEPVTP